MLKMSIFYALPNLSCGLICALLAIVFRTNKKAYLLIAGFNTLPKAEKAKYDSKKLCHYFCKLLLLLAVEMVIPGIIISQNIAVPAMLISSWSIFIITLIVSQIYLKQQGKFKI
ncbi:MAG: DUF3784 domain-containing protein [Dehalococcoidia bacterium]|nr:DUF3784 domain-containing protein [Dehalococcoidia bacterium]